MIDSYLEQCKQAGRELAIKEASLGLPTGTGVVVPALLAASGLFAKSPGLRAANRFGAAATGFSLGGAAGAGLVNPQHFSAIKEFARGLPTTIDNVPPHLLSDLSTIAAPALAFGYGANKLVRGGEKLNRAIREARARSRPTFSIKPVDILTF